MAEQTTHNAQGEGLIPHDTNPTPVSEDVEAAMKQAVDAAEETGDTPELELDAPADIPAEIPAEESREAPATEPGDLPAPAQWSAEDQEIFRSVDKNTQEWLLARDKAVAEQYQEQLSAVQPLQQVSQTWDPYFKQLGMPPAELLNGLLQTEMKLRTGTPQQKQDALIGIMRSYGIGVGQEQAQQLPEDIQQDPVAQALNQRLNEVLEGQQTLKSQMENQFGALQVQQVQSQVGALHAFRDQTDAEGKPLHPYFSEVENLMDTLAANAMATGQQTTLEDVYQQACWASPGVRAKLQSADRSAGIAGRQQTAADKQRAGKSVSGSPAGSRTVQVADGGSDESVHDTVMKAYTAHAGAGRA